MADGKYEPSKELLNELQFRAIRASGPGGQNVNKVNSKIELRWNVSSSISVSGVVRDRFLLLFQSRITNEGEILLTSGRFRDQLRNKEDCLERLAEMIWKAAHPPKKRKKTRIPRSVNEKRIEKKAQTSQRKSQRRKPAADY